MSYLQRLRVRPDPEMLTRKEQRYVQAHFEPSAAEVVINNRQVVSWTEIEEVEIAVAARTQDPSGWLVKNLLMGGERYHVGLYFGREEAVLTNLTLNTARYIVQVIAFYSPHRVAYTGPDDLDITPLTEV